MPFQGHENLPVMILPVMIIYCLAIQMYKEMCFTIPDTVQNLLLLILRSNKKNKHMPKKGSKATRSAMLKKLAVFGFPSLWTVSIPAGCYNNLETLKLLSRFVIFLLPSYPFTFCVGYFKLQVLWGQKSKCILGSLSSRKMGWWCLKWIKVAHCLVAKVTLKNSSVWENFWSGNT